MNAPPPAALKVAYLLSRFPEYSEGFIRHELREMGRLVGGLLVLPLVASPRRGAAALLAEAGLAPAQVLGPPRLLSPRPAGALLAALARNPRGLVRAAVTALGACFIAPRHGLKWLLLFPRAVWLGARAAARGTDHLHAHFAALPASAAWTIHSVFGIPYSVTAHAYDLHLPPRLLRRILSDAAFGVVVSEYTLRRARDLVPETPAFRWHVIRNGIPLDLFGLPPRRPPRPRPRILAVGRLVPQKGFFDLVEACRVLRERGTAFECRIVGDGPLREALRRRIASAGLSGEVTLAGVLTGEDLRRAYVEADLFALPCITLPGGGDTLPAVLTEAAAMGLPLVSTPVAAIPELVTDGLQGRLVPERDPRALADALGALLADAGLRRELGARARLAVEASYDASLRAGQLASLFADPRREGP